MQYGREAHPACGLLEAHRAGGPWLQTFSIIHTLHQVVSRIDPSTKYLNSIVPCIQFTMEKDSDNRILPFLDVQLCREERKEEWKSVEALTLAL